MKKNAMEQVLFLTVVICVFLAGSTVVLADDISPSNTRYKILSTIASQFSETYMLDTQSGRVWQMRGQVSNGPYLIPCVYQLSDNHTALSGLFGAPASTPRNDRFSIKCASSGQHAETYILDKQIGRVWQMRGQVSKEPYLIPCVYQLSNGHSSSSPTDGVSPSVSTSNRFSIVCNTDGQYAETFVFDSQAGYVWKLQGQVSQGPFLIPCVYQLLNGDNSKVPLDGDTEIELAKKTTQRERSQDTQGGHVGMSQETTTTTNLSPSVQKKLDNIDRKFEDDMKKLFPNEKQPK